MSCPTCQDRGWIEVPYYSDFAPTTEVQHCPDCFPEARESGLGCLPAILLILALAVLVL